VATCRVDCPRVDWPRRFPRFRRDGGGPVVVVVKRLPGGRVFVPRRLLSISGEGSPCSSWAESIVVVGEAVEIRLSGICSNGVGSDDCVIASG